MRCGLLYAGSLKMAALADPTWMDSKKKKKKVRDGVGGHLDTLSVREFGERSLFGQRSVHASSADGPAVTR